MKFKPFDLDEAIEHPERVTKKSDTTSRAKAVYYMPYLPNAKFLCSFVIVIWKEEMYATSYVVNADNIDLQLIEENEELKLVSSPKNENIFEYMNSSISTELNLSNLVELSKLGREGWALCGITKENTCILKRIKNN